MDCNDVPWELVRSVMRRAPSWARQVDGLGGTGEPPSLGRKGAGFTGLSDAAACYYSLTFALIFLEHCPPDGPLRFCRRPPRDSRVLAEIVRLQLDGYAYHEIAARLRHEGRRKLRGGGQFWSRSSVAHALERAYRCLCCPKGGAFLNEEEWK